MKKGYFFIILLLNLVFLQAARAEQIRAFVAEFKIVGAEHPAEMKGLLPDLLGSRLNVGQILIVETRAAADIVVEGRYTMAGNLFSIDAVASNAAGKVVSRAYVEGENQGQLLPAVGKLASKLAAQITASVNPKTKTEEAQAVITTLPTSSPRPSSVDIITEQTGAPAGGARWLSQRLVGSYSGMAPGRRFENGERELYVVNGRALKLFRQGKDLQLVAEVSFKVGEQVLGVDSADLDGDGNPEVYLTIFNGDALVSQVWIVKDNSLVRIADKLPYYFRNIAMEGQKGTLFAQEMSLRSDYFGDVREVVRTGAAYTLGNPVKLPRGAMLYNFNRFKDGNGNLLFALLNEDGHLFVHAANGEELWRSKEKYGGTEQFFKRKDLSDVKYGSEPYRWIFLQQRIFVTQEGEIVVPQNSGSWNTGYSRTYSNSRLIGFSWNGSSLERKWHTQENENYLADYYYDPLQQELVTLEVVKHEGMFDKGASIISIRKVRMKGE